MKFINAFEQEIENRGLEVFNLFDLGVIFGDLFISKRYNGVPLNIKRPFPDNESLNRYIKQLLTEKRLYQILGHELFSLSSSSPNLDDLLFAMDPLCFLSHGSAMRVHGLIDAEAPVVVTSLPRSLWKKSYMHILREILGEGSNDYLQFQLPLLSKPTFDDVSNASISLINSSDRKGLIQYKNGAVTSIERTFIDILRKPNLCGGMEGVLKIFEEKGLKYFDRIFRWANEYGTQMDKVRLGYIFNEYLGFQDQRLLEWEKFIQRGGSRKLDSVSKYSSTYSEKWCLSINL